MKHLKIFENFNKSEIDELCKEYNVQNYKINEDGSVDAEGDKDGNVILSKRRLRKIPIKFNKVNNFYCDENQLESLINSPIHVVGNFYCNKNNLTTLDNGPDYVRGLFTVAENKLDTLIGCPKYIGGRHPLIDRNIINFAANNLRDFYGFPESYSGDLLIHNNPVYEILELIDLFSSRQIILFIQWLNTYTVIRNKNTIVEDRLIEALNAVGIKELDKKKIFKNYKLI